MKTYVILTGDAESPLRYWFARSSRHLELHFEFFGLLTFVLFFFAYTLRVFGFTSPTAIQSGKTGIACRGEDHEVELVWSIRSGKMRVCWNKRNITSLFRKGQRSTMVDVAWKTRSNQTLQIVAHASALPGVDQQYDLIVDGTSFWRLPLVADLGKRSLKATEVEIVDVAPNRSIGRRESLSTTFTVEHLPEALDYRLSMAGLGNLGWVEVVDELHSEMYSPALETVRHHIVECLPQVEGMVSRAIMDAFISDAGSDSWSSSCSSWSEGLHESEMGQIELAALWEAFEWTRLSAGRTCPDNAEEQALLVMKKKITDTFRRIRTGDLQSHAATHLLLSVGAILGLEFASPIPKDTVFLFGLPGSFATSDLRERLSAYGYVDNVAVARSGTGFAFCRFVNEESPILLRDDIDKGQLLFERVKPGLVILSEKSGREFSSSGLFAESRQDIDLLPAPRTFLHAARHEQVDTEMTQNVFITQLSSNFSVMSDLSDRRSPVTKPTSLYKGAQHLSPQSVAVATIDTSRNVTEAMFSSLIDGSSKEDDDELTRYVRCYL
jgi:hypothetical protein